MIMENTTPIIITITVTIITITVIAHRCMVTGGGGLD
jgi:hypothetical protein